MTLKWTFLPRFIKLLFVMVVSAGLLGGCSTNPATGKSQFTGLMSPQQEVSVGAQEHEKIEQQFGFYDNPAVVAYVREIGARVSQKTERSDVQYKFYVLDSPIVNAFVLPGGYVYVSRGLLALANNEAELAAVLSHEIGHITGRHSAERYSTGVLTSLGAAVISAAVDNSTLSQALGLGSNLYLSSYSRGQENEADTLGLRYMTRGGYDARAMSTFLNSLQQQTALESRIEGKSGAPAFSYLSTHPATSERVNKTMAEAGQYPQGGNVNHERYLGAVDGMIYGDSAKQGFARDQIFYHPEIGFTFTAPNGFQIVNQPGQVVAVSQQAGSVIVFDMVGHGGVSDPYTFLTQKWMQKESVGAPERITINGMNAATASFPGSVDGRPVTIRLVAIQWSDKTMARFQIAIPQNAGAGLVDALKKTTYSFRKLSAQEKQNLKPYTLDVVTAGSGDTVASLARRQPYTSLQEERFRVLNGMAPGEGVQAGRKYKIVVD